MQMLVATLCVSNGCAHGVPAVALPNLHDVIRAIDPGAIRELLARPEGLVLSGIVAITATLLFGLYSAVIRSRIRRDVERLRRSIRSLPGTQELPLPQGYRFGGFRLCANELTNAAEQIGRQQDRLNRDAMRDPLTGLPNRRTFIYTLSHEVAFAQRTQWPLSVIIVDLDHFKTLNDTFGHQAGDFVLERTARRLASLIRQSDVVARIGGEEFVVVLPGTKLSQAMQVAQQLRTALRCDQFVYERQQMRVTASFGVAELHECGAQDADSLVRCADEALYKAKRSRDMVVAAPSASDSPMPLDFEESAEIAELPADTVEPPDTRVDRDTMALMGSMFSILQVIPDKYRVAQDAIQQVAAVLHWPQVRLAVHVPKRECLAPLASINIEAPASSADPLPVDDLNDWFDDLRSGHQFFPRRRVEPIPIDLDEEGRTSKLRLPLVAYGEVFGVIEASTGGQRSEVSNRQTVILSALGAIGATALHNCNEYQRLEQRWLGLVEALCATIHSLDSYQGDHARRVGIIAFKLAVAMGQHDEGTLQMVRIAGLVHDIGKVGLPRRLFQKSSRLRSSERKVLQRHCAIGAELLAGVADMEPLSQIVRSHHEHYDGAGYPDRLAGHEIPIESRILAVADAYDAMTSRRPYRPPFSHGEAIERIRQAMGTQFDPAVAAVMIECFGGEDGRQKLLSDDETGQDASPMPSAPTKKVESRSTADLASP